MRSECVNHKFVYEISLQTERLLTTVADLHQRATQSYVRRPYGVGLLVAGYDARTGPRLFQTCPSGNMYEWKAHALGARSQAARTYLERSFAGYAARAFVFSPCPPASPSTLTHARNAHNPTNHPQWTAMR